MALNADEITERLRAGRRIGALPAAALLAAVAACATSLAQGRIERTIGHATYHDIMTEIPEALQRYGYAIYYNRETTTALYIETGWQERAPFEDESEQGVDYARTRFIARARRSGPGTYTLRLTSENQVRGLPDGSGEPFGLPGEGWARINASDMYQEYVREISDEIEMQVAAGLRTYGRIRTPGT